MTSVEIAVPAYNEEKELQKAVQAILVHIGNKNLSGYTFSVTIVNNGSSDSTPRIGQALARRYPNVKFLNLKRSGRGRALRTCFMKSQADILSYTDVDLSAGLTHLKELIDALVHEGADIAIGSRLVKGAKVSGRTPIREIMSRGYNVMLRLLFRVSFHDAQCGFKAVKKTAFRRLAPYIKNRNWFFDSEMLIIASKLGMKIREIPVTWKDDPGSTVKVARTAKEDIMGILRLLITRPWKTFSRI